MVNMPIFHANNAGSRLCHVKLDCLRSAGLKGECRSVRQDGVGRTGGDETAWIALRMTSSLIPWLPATLAGAWEPACMSSISASMPGRRSSQWPRMCFGGP